MNQRLMGFDRGGLFKRSLSRFKGRPPHFSTGVNFSPGSSCTQEYWQEYNEAAGDACCVPVDQNQDIGPVLGVPKAEKWEVRELKLKELELGASQ